MERLLRRISRVSSWMVARLVSTLDLKGSNPKSQFRPVPQNLCQLLAESRDFLDSAIELTFD
jgi:hypothetical protein